MKLVESIKECLKVGFVFYIHVTVSNHVFCFLSYCVKPSYECKCLSLLNEARNQIGGIWWINDFRSHQNMLAVKTKAPLIMMSNHNNYVIIRYTDQLLIAKKSINLSRFRFACSNIITPLKLCYEKSKCHLWQKCYSVGWQTSICVKY